MREKKRPNADYDDTKTEHDNHQNMLKRQLYSVHE